MRNNATNGYNDQLTYDDFVFLSVSKVFIQGISMPFVGDWSRELGCKWSIFIGSGIYSVGYILTYWTVRYYYFLAVITLSLHGIGFSFIYATAVGAAQKWFPKSMKGFVGSIVLSGYGFGSLIWIPLQTSFVNPDNIPAEYDPRCNKTGNISSVDTIDCHNRYYTNIDLLDRVPGMFFILGIIYTVCGVISVILISEPDPASDGSLEENESLNPERQEAAPAKEVPRSLKPREVLKTSVFYQIWLSFFSVGLCNGLMSTYSKTYGLTFINDDHFYAIVAVFQNIFNGACRIVWGFLYDRIEMRTCFLVVGILITIVTSCLPAVQYLGEETIAAKLGYSFLMVLLYAVFPGMYSIVAAAVNDAFGPDHYKANFGLLYTQSMAYCVVMLVITKVPVIQLYLGYTGMFLVAGAFGLLGTVAVSFLPRRKN